MNVGGTTTVVGTAVNGIVVGNVSDDGTTLIVYVTVSVKTKIGGADDDTKVFGTIYVMV